MNPIVDWRQELCTFQQCLEFSSGDNTLLDTLKRPITDIFSPGLITLHSGTSVYDAIVLLLESRADFALVQDSPDSINGVIRIESLDQALIEDAGNRGLTVSSFMDRNVCIEPDCATCLEVMNRITLGYCPCTVLINQRGEPCGIITPRLLIEVLAEQIPLECLTGVSVFRRSA